MKPETNPNIDRRVVLDFGDEWTKFDQAGLSNPERTEMFQAYFSILPWDQVPGDAEGFDVGCGSGRWAYEVAPRVKLLHCIDASDAAIAVAKRNLAKHRNCRFHCASVDAIPLDDDSMDFGYALGVLHHVPDTQSAVNACVAKLKPGAPLLLYLYFAFDNKPAWYRATWRLSDFARRLISRSRRPIRDFLCELIAVFVYWPLARSAVLFETVGFDVDSYPLSSYRRKSLYVMRTDARDRLGPRLQRRFTKVEIERCVRRDWWIFASAPAGRTGASSEQKHPLAGDRQ